jgi:DNA-binding NtrC family response regulator
LPLDTQVKLLRAIQQGEIEPLGSGRAERVNVRVISATNKRLLNLAKSGAFREDLYYRLNVFPIHIPPLRDRQEDIPALAKFFLELYSRRFSRAFNQIDPEALRLLTVYRWPGNIRELKNSIERICIMQAGPILLPGHLPLEIGSQVLSIKKAPAVSEDFALGLEEAVSRFEKQLIVAALEKSGGNVLQAAQLLQIPRGTLRYKMEKLETGDR